MIISAKFASKCPVCSGSIHKGDRVQWSRGQDARHEVCPMQEAASNVQVTVASSRMNKRPHPFMRKVDRESPELDWTPECIEMYSVIGGVAVRAGEAFAIVRPGSERWPLGIASDHYKPTDHVACDKRILEECLSAVEPGECMVSGHGYRVVYGYTVKHMSASKVGGHVVSTRLVVAHDHTGKGAMRASMCLYLDGKAIGAIVTTSAMHVAAQPGIWQQNIEAMIETALVAQDAVLDLLWAAESRTLTDEDIAFLERKGLRMSSKPKTALDALVDHHEGRNAKITWGVWERRMNDEGIRAVLALLPAEVSQALDASLRSRVLSCIPRRYSRAT